MFSARDLLSPRTRVRLFEAWRSSGLGQAVGARALKIIAVLLVMVTGIGFVDYLTGPLPSLSIFYLLPVSAGAMLLGRRGGFLLSALCGASSLFSDVVFVPHDVHRGVSAWNALLMVVTLMVLVELLARLRERTLEAVKAEERSREFLAFAAHQLRTPIAALRSGVDALVVGGADEPEASDVLSGLARDADRAARLISSLLRVARLDEHEPLPMRTADVACIAHEEMQRTAIRHPSLSWEFEVVPGADTGTACNPDSLSEAIANLLDNASRHARHHVEVSVREGDRGVEVAVTDDGAGLPRAGRDTAFLRFVSLDGDGGSGLGLAIARGICEAHGGTLRYDERSFVVSIPKRAVEDRVRSSASSTSS
jgi:signal transduction histidine kinase